MTDNKVYSHPLYNSLGGKGRLSSGSVAFFRADARVFGNSLRDQFARLLRDAQHCTTRLGQEKTVMLPVTTRSAQYSAGDIAVELSSFGDSQWPVPGRSSSVWPTNPDI